MRYLSMSAQHSKKLALLDLDGTLINTVPLIVKGIMQGIENIGRKLEEKKVKKALLSDSIGSLLEHYGITPEDFFADYYITPMYNQPLLFPDTKYFLESLKKNNYETYVVTTSSETATKEKIRNSGLESLIDGFRASFKNPLTKPNPEIVRDLIEGNKYKNIIVVGDSMQDVKFYKNIREHLKTRDSDVITQGFIIHNKFKIPEIIYTNSLPEIKEYLENGTDN